jgi:hypothetical protein
MTKYTFEDYLSFIEDKLGLQLLSWQKDFLQKMYNGEYDCYMSGRGIGKTVAYKAGEILKELMNKENNNEKHF